MRHEVAEGQDVWEDGTVKIEVISARDGRLVVEITPKPPAGRGMLPPLPEVEYLKS
jgi:hypothetical protein